MRQSARAKSSLPARTPHRAKPTPRQRYKPADRKSAIAREAATFFAEEGFEGHTRYLATRLGITQPLLYRYFPSKDALIERVYQDLFVGRWNPAWEGMIADRSVPLNTRLIRFYQDYARVILTYEWVRLFMFAGLRDLGLNARYLAFLRKRFFNKAIGEIRHEHNRPSRQQKPVTHIEIEMIWGLHARIFYLGVRRFIYNMPLKGDVDDIIEAHVVNFLGGIQDALAGSHSPT